MNISIMIPTKNRPNFILRQLEYYSKAKFQGNILVGDASNQKLFNKTKKNIKKYEKNLKIQHFHKPDLSTDITNSFLCHQVETDFCAYVADDDIILVESLSECINFLNQNQEYSSVHGKAFLMSLEGGEGKPIGKVVSISNYKMATSIKDSALDRVEEYFDNPRNLNMAVIRTSINIDAFNVVNDLSSYYASYIFCEVIHASVVLARGKVGEINQAYLIRQSHSEQQYKKFNLSEWHSNKGFNSAYETLKSTIDSELISKGDFDEDDVSTRTSNILSKWLNHLQSENNMHEISTKKDLSFKLKGFIKKSALISSIYKKIRFNIELSRSTSKNDIDSKNDIRFFIDLVEKNSRYFEK
jgi:glycosyltransferase domain-containing protein